MFFHILHHPPGDKSLSAPYGGLKSERLGAVCLPREWILPLIGAPPLLVSIAVGTDPDDNEELKISEAGMLLSKA